MSCSNSQETHRLTCHLEFEPAGLERLLQVVRRRGFVVERMHAEHDEAGLHVDLTVSGARSPETLRAQLERIHTVRSVQRPLERCFVADPAATARARLGQAV